jgi:hypothetical protein
LASVFLAVESDTLITSVLIIIKSVEPALIGTVYAEKDRVNIFASGYINQRNRLIYKRRRDNK